MKFKKGVNVGGWLSQYEFIAQSPLTEEFDFLLADSFLWN